MSYSEFQFTETRFGEADPLVQLLFGRGSLMQPLCTQHFREDKHYLIVCLKDSFGVCHHLLSGGFESYLLEYYGDLFYFIRLA